MSKFDYIFGENSSFSFQSDKKDISLLAVHPMCHFCGIHPLHGTVHKKEAAY